MIFLDTKMDPIAFVFAQCWLHRRNRLIAVGGLAMACLGLGLVFVNVPWVPGWLFKVAMSGFSVFALPFVALLGYYTLKAIALALRRLLGRVPGRHNPSGPPTN